MGSLAPRARSPWQCFDNIVLCSCGCHWYLLWSLCKHITLVGNDVVGYTSYKRNDRCQECAEYQKFPWQAISDFIIVKDFHMYASSVQPMTSFGQLVQHHLLYYVMNDKTDKASGVVIPQVENVSSKSSPSVVSSLIINCFMPFLTLSPMPLSPCGLDIHTWIPGGILIQGLAYCSRSYWDLFVWGRLLTMIWARRSVSFWLPCRRRAHSWTDAMLVLDCSSAIRCPQAENGSESAVGYWIGRDRELNIFHAPLPRVGDHCRTTVSCALVLSLLGLRYV